MYPTILLPALIAFLLSMFLVDTLQVLLRVISAVVSAPVLGAHLGSIFMLLNRAATAFALLTIGYLVDTGLQARYLLLSYIAASLLLALCHFPLLRRKLLLAVTLKSFRVIYGETCDPATLLAASQLNGGHVKYKISISVCVVTAIGFIGLLAPSLLASTFPEYRATLMQTGFIMNSIASIMNVFQVERKIAMTIHGGNYEQLNVLYSSYTVSRAIGYMSALILFALPLMASYFLH